MYLPIHYLGTVLKFCKCWCSWKRVVKFTDTIFDIANREYFLKVTNLPWPDPRHKISPC